MMQYKLLQRAETKMDAFAKYYFQMHEKWYLLIFLGLNSILYLVTSAPSKDIELLYLLFQGRKLMKKNLTTNLAKSDLLRPIDHLHKPVTFRTIIKCRNQSCEPLELEKLQSQNNLRSLGEERSGSVDPTEQSSRDQSPVKQLMRGHLKKQTLNLATTQRSDRQKIEVIDPCNE